MRLLALLTWPYVRKHVLRTILTLAGIALGAAVFVGMHTANQAVLGAFSATIDRIAGKTDLQVTAGEHGFGEDVLERVQSSASVSVAVPVIEAVAESPLEGVGSVLILGIDMTGDRSLRDYDLESGEEAIVDDPLIFLAQPDSIIVARELAARRGLSAGSPLTLATAEGNKQFTIRGIMEPAGLATAFGGNVAIMDVYAAQKMFGRGPTFDRIDLAVAEGSAVEEAVRELTALLGPGFDVQPPAVRGQRAESMLAGYTLMVNISSVFALFVGMFIIYNAFATAVAQRRSEIGVLRALGATRGQISRLFLIEGALIGIVGSLIGAALGLVSARAIGSAMAGIAGDLYGVAQPAEDPALNLYIIGLALALGIVTSVIAAAIPAAEAARIDPVHAMKKGAPSALASGNRRLRTASAAACIGVSAVLLLVGPGRLGFFCGYALAIAAAVLLAPAASRLLARALRPLLRLIRPVEGSLAADSLIQAPHRTSACVNALMLSLALVLAFAGMAGASYRSVIEWMDTTLNPDLFVMPSPRLELRTLRFPAEISAELASIEGVGRVQAFRNGRVTLRGRQAMLVAIEMTSVAATVRARPVAGRIPEMYHAAARGEGLIVSDSLAQMHGLSAGDMVELAAPYGLVSLPIVGIIVDYTDQQGTVFIDRSVFLEKWRDDSVNDFRIYVSPSARIADVRQRIVKHFAGQRQLFVLTNEESREYVLGVTGQWFELMNVQIGVAILVALLGIVNSLTVSITDRRRELGVLQAVGALRQQIRNTIWLEALSVALIGVILGCALGAVNLFYLLDIVRRDVAGMRLDYVFPAATALALVPAMLLAGLVAALWPAEAAVRGSLVEALEYE